MSVRAANFRMMATEKQVLYPSDLIGKTIKSVQLEDCSNGYTALTSMFLVFEDNTFMFLRPDSPFNFVEEPTPEELRNGGLVTEKEYRDFITNVQTMADMENREELYKEFLRLKAMFEPEGAGYVKGTAEGDIQIETLLSKMGITLDSAIDANIHETSYSHSKSMGTCGIYGCVTHGAIENPPEDMDARLHIPTTDKSNKMSMDDVYAEMKKNELHILDTDELSYIRNEDGGVVHIELDDNDPDPLGTTAQIINDELAKRDTQNDPLLTMSSMVNESMHRSIIGDEE